MYGADIDEIQDLRKELRLFKEIVYNFLDFAPTCDENGKCYVCGAQWYPNECEDTCLAILLYRATKEVDSSSTIWLDLCDKLDAAKEYIKDLEEESEHHKRFS